PLPFALCVSPSGLCPPAGPSTVRHRPSPHPACPRPAIDPAPRGRLMRTPTLALLASAALTLAARAEGPAPAKVEVFPPEVNLTTARDRQLVVVQATYPDGITRDVTAEATITPANPGLLRREGHTLWPAADGETTLTVAFGGRTVDVPVKVAQAATTPPVSFRLDVMPVFMRAGCNTGSCHG